MSFHRHALFTGVLALVAGLLFFAPDGHSQPAAPKEIRIGFQKSEVNLVILKQQGALEKRFPDSKVSWIEFPAGPQLLEALAVGSLEIGLTGDSPPVFAQAAGKDLRYVGAEPPQAAEFGPPREARLVAAHAGRPEGQEGRLPEGLQRALPRVCARWRRPGCSGATSRRSTYRRRTRAPPSSAAASTPGLIWDPYYAATELDIEPRVLSNGVGLSGNNSFYLASTAFTQNHPQAVQVLLDELTRADAYVQSHRKESAQVHRRLQRPEPGDGGTCSSRAAPPSPVKPLSPGAGGRPAARGRCLPSARADPQAGGGGRDRCGSPAPPARRASRTPPAETNKNDPTEDEGETSDETALVHSHPRRLALPRQRARRARRGLRLLPPGRDRGRQPGLRGRAGSRPAAPARTRGSWRPA